MNGPDTLPDAIRAEDLVTAARRPARTQPRPDDDGVLQRAAAIEAPLDPSLYTTLRRVATSPDTKLVLSLGGGAAPGLCGNCALVRIVEELGLREHVAEVWGTSAGAIVGGGWASGTPVLRVLEIVAGLARGRSVDVRWWPLIRSVLFRWLGAKQPDALVGGDAFHRAIEAGLTAHTFEECEIPFRCIAATDGAPVQRHVFRSGPLLPAISASMSLPGVLLARHADGTSQLGYYDGGLVEKTPLRSPIADHARSNDKRRLLVLGTHFNVETTQVEVARGYMARFIATIHATESLVWSYQHAEAARRDDVTLLLFDPHVTDTSSFDFARTRRSYLEAREYLRDRLQNAKLALSLALP
jgi:predicted acylesterase/phospholipase RssA